MYAGDIEHRGLEIIMFRGSIKKVLLIVRSYFCAHWLVKGECE